LNPEITIIIPTYNRSEKIIYTLESLIAQTFRNWECIIIDDNSNLSEFEKLKDFIQIDKRIILIKKPPGKIKGPSSSRNLGLEIAKGKYIQFFDDDDEMYSSMLEEKLKKIKFSNFDVVVSSLDIYEVEKNKIQVTNKIFSDDIIKDYVLGNISWYVSGPIWKKGFLKERFDEEIQTLDDWDFNLRNLYNHPKIGFIEHSLQKYNRYGVDNSLSTRKEFNGFDQSKSVFCTYKKHFIFLKKNEMLTSKISNSLISRMVFLLRKSLVAKNKISSKIFKFLISQWKRFNLFKLLKIIIGYSVFLIFNRGYRFINY